MSIFIEFKYVNYLFHVSRFIKSLFLKQFSFIESLFLKQFSFIESSSLKQFSFVELSFLTNWIIVFETIFVHWIIVFDKFRSLNHCFAVKSRLVIIILSISYFVHEHFLSLLLNPIKQIHDFVFTELMQQMWNSFLS